MRIVERRADRGLALANIGAWTEQTVAGAISTVTHQYDIERLRPYYKTFEGRPFIMTSDM